MMKFSAFCILAALALQGCASVVGTTARTPAQDVYALEGAYSVALATAVTYTRLPSCSTGARLCSTLVMKSRLQTLDGVAWASILTAEDAVRKGTPTDAYILDASRAVTNFLNLSTTLKIR